VSVLANLYRMQTSLKLLPAFIGTTLFAATLCVCDADSFETTSFSDAFVATGTSGELSGNNYGGGGALALAASGLPLGEFQSVLQFNLSAARNSFDAQFGAGLWTVQSVTLQLTASPHGNAIYNEIAAGQFSVSLLQNNSWAEGTGNASTPTADGISFNTLQNTYINTTTDQALGTFSFGGTSGGADSYSLNLTSGLLADALAGDNLSLRLFAADDQVSYLFTSRANGTVANRPTLIINAVPEPACATLYVLGLAALWRNARRDKARL
jgi:hypothetical protein